MSDRAIFEQSDLVKKCMPGQDAIMANKGFLIETVTSLYNIKINRLPFLKKKKQFSKDEATINVAIASARIYIERSNQRLKVFKILSNKSPWNLINIVHEILVAIRYTLSILVHQII